jgi:hypothetical protein
MYKRPQLRVREPPNTTQEPVKIREGTFLHDIIKKGPTEWSSDKREIQPIYQKDVYLALLKRNNREMGIEWKEPNIPDYVPPERPVRPIEPELPFPDKIYMKVRILKSGIIRIKLDSSFAVLHEKYYSQCKVPPMKSIIRAYTNMGFSPEFIERIKTKFSKFSEHKKKVEKIIESTFNKEPVKKPKKVKKKEEMIEDEIEEIEDDRDDEIDEDDDPPEDGEMDVEVDEDPEEQPPDDQEEAYISD